MSSGDEFLKFLFGKVFNLPSFLMDSFLKIELLVDRFFSFSVLNKTSHYSLAWKIPLKKSAESLMGISLHAMSLFSCAALNFLSLNFENLIIMSLVVISGYILFRSFGPHGSEYPFLSPGWEIFIRFSLNMLYNFSFSSLYVIPTVQILFILFVSHMSSRRSSLFFIFFFLLL